MDVLKLWIERRIIELMGQEDEIVILFAIEQIMEAKENKTELCPKKMQITLTGFLEENAATFME